MINLRSSVFIGGYLIVNARSDYGSVSGNLCLEVTEAHPFRAAVKINFRDGDGSPLLRQGDGLSLMVENGG